MAAPGDVSDHIDEQEFKSPSVSRDPAIAPPLPFWRPLIIGTRLWLFKFTVWSFFRFVRLYQRTPFSKTRPTFTKYYDVRPNLECRVFLPSNTKVDSKTKLPLYINIHGGGFALCVSLEPRAPDQPMGSVLISNQDPSVDDHFAHPFSQTHSILVVSINYSKSPVHRFPTAVNDVVALISAVLSDPLLPIDHTRVCLGGFSAGGNLTLTAALHPSLRNKISALLPIYPVVDFSGRYKGAFRKDPWGKPDILQSSGALFTWGYIAQGTDRKHPLLSPIFAPRSAFATTKMFFVGAEFDYLHQEAHTMAKRLAGRSAPVDGRDGDGADVTEGVRMGEVDEEWEQDGIKWKMWRGQQHGFTHTRKTGEQERQRRKATEECYAEMGRWLKENVWGMAKGDGDQRQENGPTG